MFEFILKLSRSLKITTRAFRKHNLVLIIADHGVGGGLSGVLRLFTKLGLYLFVLLLDFLRLLIQIIFVRVQNLVLVLLIPRVIRQRLQYHFSSEVADQNIKRNLSLVIHVHDFLVERGAVFYGTGRLSVF